MTSKEVLLKAVQGMTEEEAAIALVVLYEEGVLAPPDKDAEVGEEDGEDQP
jgi:hypothetical protein